MHMCIRIVFHSFFDVRYLFQIVPIWRFSPPANILKHDDLDVHSRGKRDRGSELRFQDSRVQERLGLYVGAQRMLPVPRPLRRELRDRSFC